MDIKELDIPGCYKINPNIFRDKRGIFVKTFHADSLKKYGLDIDLKEEFYSISNKNVLRGLHFQSPPAAHAKLVYCPSGAVLDFFVDIRIGSPAYGKEMSIELSETNRTILFLPVGIAHGFLSLKDNSLMIYKTDYEYDSVTDSGINFNSINIELPVTKEKIIISTKDLSLPILADYKSEFLYE